MMSTITLPASFVRAALAVSCASFVAGVLSVRAPTAPAPATPADGEAEAGDDDGDAFAVAAHGGLSAVGAVIFGVDGGVKFVPAVDADGRVVGVRLFDVKDGGAAARAGFKDGDVVTGVNGVDLAGVDDPLAVVVRDRDRGARVDILRGGVSAVVGFDAEEVLARKAAVVAPVVAPVVDAGCRPAGAVEEDLVVVDEALRTRLLARLDDASVSCRLVPAFAGGKPVGFKLFGMQPGSRFAALGLQNGDVVTCINGHPLSSPEKGLEVYEQLKSASLFAVDVVRDGVPHALHFSVE